MSKRLQDLPPSATVPAGSYMLLKYDVDGDPIDFSVSTDLLFSDFVVRSEEVGTGIGDLFTLVNDGLGNPALPTLSGKNLFDLNIPTGNASTLGLIKISDSLVSAEDVDAGVAASPKSVRDVNELNVKLAGDELTGELTFQNDKGILGKDLGGTAVTITKMNGSDELEVGDAVGTEGINVRSAGDIKFYDTAGAVIFQINQSGTILSSNIFQGTQTFTGDTAGIKSADVIFVPYGDITATKVQEAIQQVHDLTPGLEWIFQADGDFVVVEGNGYFASGGTATLPASPTGEFSIAFSDKNDDWLAAPLVLNRNGNTIEGLAEDLVLDVQGLSVELTYVNSDWKIITTSNTSISSSEVVVDKLGSGSIFTLSSTPPSKDSIQVVVDGSLIRDSGFTLVGDQLTLSVAAVTYCDVRQFGVKYPVGAPVALVVFNGTGTPSISHSRSVTGVVDNGVGNYTINTSGGLDLTKATFEFSAADANVQIDGVSLPSGGDVTIKVVDDSGTPVDSAYITVSIFGGR